MQSAFFPAQQQQQQSLQPGTTTPSASAQDHKSGRKATVTQTGSPARHAAPGSINQAGPTSSRALRFPSSRRYLWDRTAAGPQVLIDVLDYLPHVQVAASTFGAITRASNQPSNSLTLQLRLSVLDSNQVSALIQEHDPLDTRGALQLGCTILGSGAAAAADVSSNLRSTMQAHFDQRGIAAVQQLFALSAHASAAATPADPTSLKLQLLMPRAGLLATPLYTKRLCHVPLAEAMLKPGCMPAGQTGYLSMDQARSLLPLEATDANVYSTPLVGVWVKGPSSVLHPLVAAACLRFAFNSLLADRAINPEDAAFLLLLCPEGDPVSKCFEVQMTDSSKLELSCYRLEAALRSAGGLAQCPGGVVHATWLPEQQQVQPLPGALNPATAAAPHGLHAGATAAYSSRTTTSAAGGTPARAAAGSLGGWGGVREHSPAGAADSPVIHPHSQVRRAGELAAGRSSASYASWKLQQGTTAAVAAATRRSLPLAYQPGGAYDPSSSGRGAAAAEAWGPQAVGVPGWSADEPQPRAGVPAGPYVAYTQAGHQPWLQPHQQPGQGTGEWVGSCPAGEQPYAQPTSADNTAAVEHGQGPLTDTMRGGNGAGSSTYPPCGSCSSPTKLGLAADAIRQQQQQSWSDRQDQLLRSSLEGAAEALRSSQASLAAAREAASGASSRLSSPTKARGPDARDTEFEGSPRMGSPVRAGVQKKASMLAAAAAHSAEVAAAAAAAEVAAAAGEGAAAAAAGGGSTATGRGAAADVDEPASPSVKAGLALSNLSLLQHLSSGQLQQAHALAAVGDAAVAAAAGSPAGREVHSDVDYDTAATVTPSPGVTTAHAGTTADAAVTDSYNASHAAAAALRAASSSMQRVPVHPYASQNLGVQRYAADVAAMHSSQGSPGFTGLLSPGGSPGMGMYETSSSASATRWQPLQQQQQAPAARMPSDWSPNAGATPGAAAVRSSGGGRAMRGSISPYWQQQQAGGQQLQQQVSPVSAALSPGWVPDPVAQALQEEVDRLRQQLQQVQQQLKSAGMALPSPRPDSAATQAATPAPTPGAAPAASPVQAAAPAEAPTAAVPSAAPAAPVPAAAPAGSPIHVHNVYPVHINMWMPGQQQQQGMGSPVPGAYVDAGPAGWELQAMAHGSPVVSAWQGQHSVGMRYPTVSYAGQQEGQDLHLPSAAESARPAAGAAVQQSTADMAPAPSAPPLEVAPAHSPEVRQQAAAADSAAAAAAGIAAAGSAAAQGAALSRAAAGPDGAAVAGSTAVQAQGVLEAAATAQQSGQERQEIAAPDLSDQQQAAANAARQRRRKLDFAAADSDGASSDGTADSSAAREAASASRPAAVAAAAAGGSAASRSAAGTPQPPDAAGAKGFQSSIPHPAFCSSPAVQPKEYAKPSKGGVGTDRAADSVRGSGVGGSALRSSGGGGLESKNHSAGVARGGALRGSGASSVAMRSSGGGLGHLRASLEVPPLVDVVRARAVDLSDDSDSDDWEDRLLVKYGLK